jgi:hypothetical protein
MFAASSYDHIPVFQPGISHEAEYWALLLVMPFRQTPIDSAFVSSFVRRHHDGNPSQSRRDQSGPARRYSRYNSGPHAP